MRKIHPRLSSRTVCLDNDQNLKYGSINLELLKICSLYPHYFFYFWIWLVLELGRSKKAIFDFQKKVLH